MTTLETSRLVLRPWTVDDAAALFPVFADHESMQYWNTPPSTGVEELRAGIRRSLAVAIEHHMAWAVILRQTAQPVGFVNYHHRDVQNRRLEIGYILARSLWRKGIASEAVSSLLSHCFNQLGAYRVEATVSPENAPSIKFLMKLGFIFEGGPMRARSWTSDGRSLDALMFALLAPDWPPAGS